MMKSSIIHTVSKNQAYGPGKKVIIRRVLFDQVQKNGDCLITGRFADNKKQTSRSDAAMLKVFRRKNNE